jgi:quercetin dioxygenase-like cupin family protein
MNYHSQNPILRKDIAADLSVGIRDKVFAAEAIMRKMPQVKIDPVHRFSQGLYAREITIPAGVTLTGEIHKYPQINFLLKGTIQVLVDEEIITLTAPQTVCSPAGTKRIAHTLTECVWTTVLPTELNNVDEIERQFIAKTENEWLEFNGSRQLELGL